MNRAKPLEFARPMPRELPPPSALRFSYESVVAEIQLYLDRKRGNQARLAEALGLDSGTFRHTMNGREGMRFSLEELAVIAETAKAPRGWPLISWRMAEEFEAFLALPPAAKELLRATIKNP